MWVFFVGYVWDTVGYCGICVDIMLEKNTREYTMPDTTTVQPALAKPPFILSLDIGTSSVRALLFDRHGHPLEGSLARATYPLHTAPDGTVETSVEAIFAALCACLDTLQTTHADALANVAAVGMCTLAATIVGLDERHQPITPLYLYADTRPTSDADTLRHTLDERATFQRTGTPFHPAYLPARVRWLRRTQPHLAARIHRWASIGAYLMWQLFGELRISLSSASWLGLLNRHTLTWDTALLDTLPLSPDALPTLTDIDTPLRGLREPWASRWPALRHIPWLPPIGDGAAANVGSGCITPEHIALTVGTSSALRFITATPPEALPWGLWCYRVNRWLALIGGALSEGGNILKWAQRTLALAPTALQDLLTTRPPDVHGLTILPFWAGERSPGWHADARATIHGLTLAHTPADIAQAIVEAIAYRWAAIFDLMRPFVPDNAVIMGGGGALRHLPAWAAIAADILERPLGLPAIAEPSARGVALLALDTLGIMPLEMAPPPRVVAFHKPRPERSARYRQARQRQQRFYELWHTRFV